MQNDCSQNILQINRQLYENEQLRSDFDYNPVKTKTCLVKTPLTLDRVDLRNALFKIIPSLQWLRHYQWSKDLLSDIAAGFTVAIMHIPQGMAYGLLGNVPPVVGIYMAFFPVIMYFLLGTSRHISMGTFAVVCLMTGNAVLKYSTTDNNATTDNIHNNETQNYLHTLKDQTQFSAIDVATCVTFVVAIFQIVMYIFRMGVISSVLSETLISGFTTGAAFQVLVSQLKDILGIKPDNHKGYFVVINTLLTIFHKIDTVNYCSLLISAITIAVCLLNTELLKPIIAKKSHFPVPIELIVIVIGTLVSRYCFLTTTYNIQIVGDIPRGLPYPSVPPMNLIHCVIWDAFTIAIVAYSVSLSLALIFAQKQGYEVNANQELLAQGVGNFVGSFFSCMPFTASLSRSSVQFTSGGKTQIVSIVSCAILLIILLWVGPFFESLPKCVLASMIVAALKSMLMQIREVWHYWQLSRLDAIVWLATFLTVTFLAVDIGLLVGVTLSLIFVFLLNLKPRTCLLGAIPHTELYVDRKKYGSAKEVDGIKIYQYNGAINFVTRNIFKSELLRLLRLNPIKEAKYRMKLHKNQLILIETDGAVDVNNVQKNKLSKLKAKCNYDIKVLIIDFSTVTYIDPSGVNILRILIESFSNIDITVYFASCSDCVYNMLQKCGLFDKKQTVRTFTTVHDAVKFSTEIFFVQAENNLYVTRI